MPQSQAQSESLHLDRRNIAAGAELVQPARLTWRDFQDIVTIAIQFTQRRRNAIVNSHLFTACCLRSPRIVLLSMSMHNARRMSCLDSFFVLKKEEEKSALQSPQLDKRSICWPPGSSSKTLVGCELPEHRGHHPLGGPWARTWKARSSKLQVPPVQWRTQDHASCG